MRHRINFILLIGLLMQMITKIVNAAANYLKIHEILKNSIDID